MDNRCPLLDATSGLAHKRGILPKNVRADCGFEATCDHVNCLKLERPNYRTLYIQQAGISEELSEIETFYARIEKSLRIIRERG